jgi:hypothetical protein
VTRIRAAYEIARRESGRLPEDGVVTELPYLPDPMAMGVVVVGFPGGSPTEPFRVRWDPSEWHRPAPITLRLLAHDELFSPGPTWDPGTRTITAQLGAARQVRIRVSSMLPPTPPLGLLAWCRKRLAEDDFRRLEATVLASRHCMFTPWQDVDLIHAVQRPLVAPDLRTGPPVVREPDETSYRFDGSTIPDAPSTGSLELIASWQEWADDPAVAVTADAADPWTTSVEAVVGSLDVPAPASEDPDGLSPRLGFADEGSTVGPLEFGNTKHRVVTFRARAVSRFAEFFPPALGQQPGGVSVEGSVVDVRVPSTARPPVPEVLDVVPTLGSAPMPDDPSVRRREGGWLRIWLARPWFATGQGEALGVVIASRPPGGPESAHYPVSSLLGTDPTHRAVPVPGLQPGHVRRAAHFEAGVILPEMKEVSIRFAQQAGLDVTAMHVPDATLALFEPQFDPASQRWFADVRIDLPGAYFPLVRLAVVRYQHHAIAGNHPLSPHHFRVSPVVHLEPVPLLPDRELRVDRNDPGVLRLTLRGPTYDQVRDAMGGIDGRPEALARVAVQVQERGGVPLVGPDDDWVTVATREFSRVDAGWDLTLPVEDAAAAGVQRLVVVEEDRTAIDAVAGAEPGYTERLIYAEPVTIDRRVTVA